MTGCIGRRGPRLGRLDACAVGAAQHAAKQRIIAHLAHAAPVSEPMIRFRLWGRSKSGKTFIWQAVGRNDVVLGSVSWFGRWRRYTFQPGEDMVFDYQCLREIASFLESRSVVHKAAVLDANGIAARERDTDAMLRRHGLEPNK